MRCDCCDVLLNNEELKLRLVSGEFANTCKVCLDAGDIKYKPLRPFYEEEVVKEVEEDEIFSPYSEEYWDER